MGLVWREHVAVELAEALCEGAIGVGADRHERSLPAPLAARP